MKVSTMCHMELALANLFGFSSNSMREHGMD